MSGVTVNENVLKNIIKAKTVIRKKYQALKSGRIETENLLKDTFKPITTPLQELVDEKVENDKRTDLTNDWKTPMKRKYKYEDVWKTPYQFKNLKAESSSTPDEKYNTLEDAFKTPSHSIQNNSNSTLESSTADQTIQDEFQNSPVRYFNKFEINEDLIDSKYGPHLDIGENVWKIGNSPFVIDGQSIIIKKEMYLLTPGMKQLIFYKHPKTELCTVEDFQNYKKILIDTSAARLNYDQEKHMSGNRGKKYLLIKKILESRSGSGLMIVNPQKPNYVYWDNPNELVNRLQLLIASQQAGHTNHNNEIISIIEELKEANIIE